MSRPAKALCSDLNKTQKKKQAELFAKDNLQPEEVYLLDEYKKKRENFINPQLSSAAKTFLAGRYSVDRYGTRRAPVSPMKTAIAKGGYLEAKGLELLSQLHGVKYDRQTEPKMNDFLHGKCDGLCSSEGKLIEVKTPWSTDTFMPNQFKTLAKPTWMQMQAYLELYGLSHGQVCYVLVNTPQHLIDQHAANVLKKYAFGEISSEKYDEECMKTEAFFNYDRIPLKRRVITFDVAHCPEFIEMVKIKVEKCRNWLQEFEKLHVNGKNIITSPEDYLFVSTEEDNAEPDSADTDP